MARDTRDPQDELEEEEPLVGAPRRRGGWRWFWILLVVALIVVAALVGLQRWQVWKAHEQAKREAEAQVKTQIVKALGKITDAQKKLEAEDLDGVLSELVSAVKSLDLVLPEAPEEMRTSLADVREAVGAARNTAEEQQKVVEEARKAAAAAVKEKLDAAAGKAKLVGGTTFVEPPK